MFDHHHGRGHCQPLPKQRLSMVRTTHKDDIRPRPQIHLPLCPGSDATTRGETEHINSLSPTDGWAVGEEEPMGGTISSLRDIGPTRRLERVAGNRLPRAQHTDQRHHQDGPTPGPPRVSSQTDGRRTHPIVQSKSRRSNQRDNRTEETGQDGSSLVRSDDAP
jgi:hypothetical protein